MDKWTLIHHFLDIIEKQLLLSYDVFESALCKIYDLLHTEIYGGREVPFQFAFHFPLSTCLLPVTISQCNFICIRLCASLFGAVIRRTFSLAYTGPASRNYYTCPGSTGPSAHSSSVSVSQARLAHGEALPLHFSL